jgi:hypothetical protein
MYDVPPVGEPHGYTAMTEVMGMDLPGDPRGLLCILKRAAK